MPQQSPHRPYDSYWDKRGTPSLDLNYKNLSPWTNIHSGMSNSLLHYPHKKQCELDRIGRKEIAGFHPEIWRIPKIDPNSLVEKKVLKEGGPSRVCVVENQEGHNLVLKSYKPTRRFDIRDFFGHSKAIRSLLSAEAIQRRGFQAASPFAAWSKPAKGSFLLMEKMDKLPKLQDYLDSTDSALQTLCLSALAKWTKAFHGCGVWHRDLKPSNVLVDEQPSAALSFVILDHDRNRFLETNVPRSKAIQDLAALYGGFPDSLSPKCRLTFLEAYCDENSSSSFWESWVRPIEKLANQRRHKRNQLPLPQLDKP